MPSSAREQMKSTMPPNSDRRRRGSRCALLLVLFASPGSIFTDAFQSTINTYQRPYQQIIGTSSSSVLRPASTHTQAPLFAPFQSSVSMPHSQLNRGIDHTRIFYKQGLDESYPNRPGKRRRGKKPKHSSKRSVSTAKSRREKYIWLHRATMNLLDTKVYPHGSLTKGKWHELHSMMMAWSKLISENAAAATFANRKNNSNNNNKNDDMLSASSTTPPLIVESLLKRIIDERRSGNNEVQATTSMYNLAIEAWASNAAARDGDGKTRSAAAQRAREIVQHMQALHDSLDGDDAQDIKPDARSFLTALGAWAKASPADRTAAESALDMLQWMEGLGEEGRNDDARPGVIAYSLVLDAFAKSSSRDSGFRAEKLLRRMQQEGKVRPNTFCFNMVINAWTRSVKRSYRDQGNAAADNAVRILNEMDELYEQTGSIQLRPDVVSYTSVITALANNGRNGADGAEKAEAILHRMETIAEKDGAAAVRPNTITYNAVLNAWCKSGDPRATQKAEAILRRMEEQYQSGIPFVKPDLISYNTLIHALSKSSEPDAAQKAEDILITMEQHREDGNKEWSPNLFSYNTVIEAWSKSSDRNAIVRAHAVLQRLIERHREFGDISPDAFSYNCVIFALSRSGLPDAGQRAEELLKHMEDAYLSGNSMVKPDVFGYSSAIHAWSKSRQRGAGRYAERLIARMQELHEAGEETLKPNTVTMNSAIDAWAKSGEGTLGARRAEMLLQMMEAQYEAGDTNIKPNALTYNSVMLAWARSRTKCAHRKAESVLQRMWDMYEAGNEDVKPDGCSYNTVIKAVAQSQNEGKAQKALRILRRMDKLYQAGNKETRPNEFTYTSVLNSCAFSFAVGDQLTKRKALDTAIFTLEELQESRYGSPNHVTYGMFLKACATLMAADDERRRIVVEPVFLQCCRDGQVGQLVLTQLRDAAPADLYEKLLYDVGVQSGDRITINDLPAEWRCNVRETRRPWQNRSVNSRSMGGSGRLGTRNTVKVKRERVRNNPGKLSP